MILLFHVGDDSVGFTRTLILGSSTLTEYLESREPLDSVGGTDLGFDGTIDLCDLDLVLELSRGRFVLGSERFAK